MRRPIQGFLDDQLQSFLVKVTMGSAVAFLVLNFYMGQAPLPLKRDQTSVKLLSRSHDSAIVIAESFLAGLRTGNLSSCYFLLSAECKKRISESSFIAQMQDWLAVSDRGWSLKFRHIQLTEAGSILCRVKVVAEGQAAAQPAWSWELVKEVDGWSLNNPLGLATP